MLQLILGTSLSYAEINNLSIDLSAVISRNKRKNAYGPQRWHGAGIRINVPRDFVSEIK